MMVRQGVGIFLSLLGVLVITRLVGPTEYGYYAAASGLVVFLCSVGTWGLNVYLLRKSSDPEVVEYDQAFTLFAGIGGILSLALLIGHSLVAVWLKQPQVSPLLATLALGLPLNLLTCLPITRLERNLDFKQIAFNELASQLIYYVPALPLAIAGGGAWAPTVGWLVQQIVLLGLSARSARFLPRFHWDPELIRTMVGYGLSYSSSTWVWQLRTLVNPLIVGRFAGAEAVGYVALAIRLVEVLSFARTATWRIALAALARLAEDPVRLRRAVEEGMRLQLIAVGLPLGLFAVCGVVVPLVFGDRWTPVLWIFPFIAISYLSNALFNLHSSVLYLFQENLHVTWFHALHVALFALSAAVLVPWVGMVGYGWAEMAALASYFLVHRFATERIGRIDYGPPLVWYGVGLGMIVLGSVDSTWHYLALLLPFFPLAIRTQRESLGGYYELLRNSA